MRSTLTFVPPVMLAALALACGRSADPTSDPGDACGAGGDDHRGERGGRQPGGAIAPGARWRITIAGAGRVTYGCTMHPGMTAAAVVVAA